MRSQVQGDSVVAKPVPDRTNAQRAAWMVALALSLVAVVVIALALVVAARRQQESDLDARLQKIIRIYGLSPLKVRHYYADPEMLLGQALFFDPILSGDRDVSCSTCHLLRYGLSDGLPRSIGVGGVGFGASRRLMRGIAIHPRRALDLWNRDNNAVSSFFWDGHVEVLDSTKRVFRSPLGDQLPTGFQNAMAVQSVVPITVPDEMLGRYGDRSSSYLPASQRNRRNDLVVSAQYRSVADMMKSVYAQLLKRLLGINERPEVWQTDYRTMFGQAYPSKPIKQISIIDVGNAISHFEEMAFAANASAWDQYLAGDANAISHNAKIGAIIFYGKGRCAACHAGPLFSDFKYHGVGIFSKMIVNGKLINDYGRGMVTGIADDRYKFRTPPLRNVTRRPLYFHDGSTSGLAQAIVRHLNPLENANGYKANGAFAMDREQIQSVSPILIDRITLSDAEIDNLIAFLRTLESQSRTVDQIIPDRVPSGMSFAR